ncbi:DUF4037 domain-containing protein [Ktedonobacter racemifer]|uniref:DUF4037 domain-containing protein n=1 Tax=Ktedonobacter racemifer DSM 44963 TaxID=485913 RepID=D6TSS2_KTERA|nr:DUF4037 domain-containing protein [Ktedonobacter racemifer]EFH83473.1 conserved hypothetical protein [Ktedonobacter racemifer DSM 44963]
MPIFIPGVELSRRFYEEIVRPLLVETFPELAYAAALVGPGSEVLGFDSEMSMDHDWGPRLFLFVREKDTGLSETISDMLSQRLPAAFAGFPVALPLDASGSSLRDLKRPLAGPIQHRVLTITIRDFGRIQLGYDLVQPLQTADWLTFPAHSLGEIVAGAVYHDDIGELTALRQRFVWYPHDVWLYLLACGWQRIGQEEHLMPRAGFMGDELGSALIASRLVRDVMNLCFLMERQYAPYAKWFGTGFQRLRCAGEIYPLLWRAQQAASWQERMNALANAYEVLARMQNALGVSKVLPEVASNFYDRPFRVIHGELFAQALREEITDPDMQRIAGRRLIGSLNQWSDSTDMEGIEHERIQRLYE